MRATALLASLALFTLVGTISLAQGDDPKPDNPPPSAIVITAPKEATGTGTREDPFIFTSKTKCILRLTGIPADAKPEWDTLDAPPDIEPIGQALVFSLEKSGPFQVISKNHYARCWFLIKSGTDPPTPPTPATVSQRVTAALIGPSAQSDAIILVAAAEKVVASIESYKTAAELQRNWFELLKANKWVIGSRPAITAILEEAIPQEPVGTASPPLTPAERTRISAIFNAIASGAKEVIK